MKTPQDIIKAMSASLHKQHLKPLGFKKSGNTWLKTLQWPRVINIQSSLYNTTEEARFTVNLGLLIPELRAAAGDMPLTRDPREYDCDLRLRVGNLFPQPSDKWWSVTSASDPEQLTAEVFHDLSHYGLPWFEKFPDLHTVAHTIRGGLPHFKAGLAFQLAGDPATAAEIFADALASSSPHFLPKLRRIAAANGIPLPK